MGDRVETTTDAMAANADADADAGADKAKPGGEELPLVTFVLLAYNQEKYIREAIEGAFSQTYEPLEIILSDDCSRDDTHRIMCEMAAGYRGHHRVLVRRNEINLGIGRHVNAAIGDSTGQFIVMAAGDDVSLPDRTRIMVEEWSKRGRPPCSMHSAMIYTNESGDEIRRGLPDCAEGMVETIRSGKGVWGASHCFHRAVFDTFGPFAYPIVFEDFAMSIRAHALAGIFTVDQGLVRYRKHMNDWAGDLFNGANLEEVLAKNAARAGVDVLMVDQFKADLSKAVGDGLVSPEIYAESVRACNQRYRRSRAKQLACSTSWWSRMKAVALVLRPPASLRAIYDTLYLALFPVAYMKRMAKGKRHDMGVEG